MIQKTDPALWLLAQRAIEAAAMVQHMKKKQPQCSYKPFVSLGCNARPPAQVVRAILISKEDLKAAIDKGGIVIG